MDEFGRVCLQGSALPAFSLGLAYLQGAWALGLHRVKFFDKEIVLLRRGLQWSGATWDRVDKSS